MDWLIRYPSDFAKERIGQRMPLINQKISPLENRIQDLVRGMMPRVKEMVMGPGKVGELTEMAVAMVQVVGAMPMEMETVMVAVPEGVHMAMEMVMGYVIVNVMIPTVNALGNVLPKAPRMALRDPMGQVRKTELRIQR